MSDPDVLGFDALSEDSLRAAGGLKWTRYGPAIGAFVAEMDFGTAPAVTAALHEAVDRGRLGYLTTEAAEEMARACSGSRRPCRCSRRRWRPARWARCWTCRRTASGRCSPS